MFSLVSGLLHWLCEKEELHILIVGLDHAGKTTLLQQMKGVFGAGGGVPLDKIPPTVGLNVGRMEIANCAVTMWDLGGQASMRSIWRRYCADAQGIVYVVDSADEARMPDAKAALDALLESPDLNRVPVVLLANKQDLAHAASSEAINKTFDLARYAGRASHVQGISALTCAGVKEGITWLVEHASLLPGSKKG